MALRIHWKGFEWEGLDDRGWAIRYEHNNVKISSREEPRLLRIKVKKISETEAEFSAPNFRSLKVKLQSEPTNKVSSIHIFGQDVDCEDIGDEAADWASEYIGKRSRIRRVSNIGQGVVLVFRYWMDIYSIWKPFKVLSHMEGHAEHITQPIGDSHQIQFLIWIELHFKTDILTTYSAVILLLR